MHDDEATDCRLQLDDLWEDAAFQSPLCELGEEALNGVEPGPRCRREVVGPAGMPGRPLAHLHLRVLVGRVFVGGGVDLLSHIDPADRRPILGRMTTLKSAHRKSPRLFLYFASRRQQLESTLCD
jgi:hypothetical protein